MRIALTDADREALAGWLAGLALARSPQAIDAIADSRHARVARDEDGSLAYEGRVVLVMPEGVRDVAVRVRQGVVSTRPWQAEPEPVATLPDPAAHA